MTPKLQKIVQSIIQFYLFLEKKFLKSLYLKRIDNMYHLYNITVNHFCLNDNGEQSNLWSEFQVVGKNLDEALDNANHQLKRVNDELSSNFKIDKIWILKQPLALKQNDKPIRISSLSESGIKNCLFNKNLQYFTEEFDYVKRKAQINNTSAYMN